jgi:hypothetical protein
LTGCLLITVRRRVPWSRVRFRTWNQSVRGELEEDLRFSTKIVTGIGAGVTDQNILRENIFV